MTVAAPTAVIDTRVAGVRDNGSARHRYQADSDNGAASSPSGSANDIGQNDTCLTRPSIRDGSEERPQHHSWDDVGEQHEADRPRRIETLESENEQRDESGTVTQRRLAERDEETSSARLMPNEVKNLPHQLACGA